jgi:hypothetical protein
MIFKHHQTKCRVPVFHNQNVAHWQWSLSIICEIAVIFTPFSAAWTLLTPCFVANRLAKITPSDFGGNESSNTFYSRAKSASRPHPIQPISILVQFLIASINSPTGKLSG